jgi:hypothetical protein
MTLTLWHLTLEFDLLVENFNLGHNFWFVGGMAFIFHIRIPSDKTFLLISWSLALEFDLLFQILNLGHNFWLVGARAFIFHMCIPSGKTFHLRYHDLDPLIFYFGVWLLFENFNLGHNFWLVVGRAFMQNYSDKSWSLNWVSGGAWVRCCMLFFFYSKLLSPVILSVEGQDH